MPPSGPTTSTMSARRPDRATSVGQRASPAVGSRTRTRDAAARAAQRRRRRERRDLGNPRAVRLLRGLAHDRRPPGAALLGLGRIPSRDAARGLPRHDLIDAELGRRLDGELVAVALGERLREHDARSGRRDVGASCDPHDDLPRRDRLALRPSARRRGRRRPSPPRRRARGARRRRGAPPLPVEGRRRRRPVRRVASARSEEEVQRHRVSRSGSGRAAWRTAPGGTRPAAAPAPSCAWRSPR